MRTVRWMSIATAAVVFCVAAPALADAPATANSFQLGVGFRYGFLMNDEADVAVNPWGAGLGVNAGFTLPNAIYAGGVFEYFFGESKETVSTYGSLKVSANLWQLMAEGGYDIGLANFVIRPKVGFGYANVKGETCLSGACESDSKGYVALAPGATFMVFLPKLRLSADVRYELVFADTTGKALILTAGIGF